MSIHVVIQPLTGYGAEVVSPSPGVRQLVAGSEGATLLVQVHARIGGLSDTARFARSLAAAASEFGEVFALPKRAKGDAFRCPPEYLPLFVRTNGRFHQHR